MSEDRGPEAILQYGRSLLDRRAPVRAARVFTRGIRLHPDDPRFRVARAEALAGTCRGWRLAIADLTRALELDPGNAKLHLQRAKLLHDSAADYSSAFKDYDAAISLGMATAEAFGGRAHVRLCLRDPAGAVADYTQAVELDPSNAWLYELRGEARIVGKDYPGAVEDFTRAMALAPGRKELFEGRARAYGWLGVPESASRDLDVWIAHLDEGMREDGPSAATLNVKAIALNSQGKLEEALRTWARAVEVDPRSATARINRASTLVREGRHLEAVEDLNALAEFSPEDHDAMCVLRAECMEKLGRWKEAAADLTRAIKGFEGDAPLHARRGRARALSGDPDGALDDLAKAASLDPEGTWGKWALGLLAWVRSIENAERDE